MSELSQAKMKTEKEEIESSEEEEEKDEDEEDFSTTDEEEEIEKEKKKKESPKTQTKTKGKGKGKHLHAQKTTVKWDHHTDQWRAPEQDHGVALMQFVASQREKWQRSSSVTVDPIPDLMVAARHCAVFVEPENRSRAFNEWCSVYQYLPKTGQLATRKVSDAPETIFQYYVSRGIGHYWNFIQRRRILPTIYAELGVQAREKFTLGEKHTLLESRNSMGENIFHDLARLFGHLRSSVRNDAVWFYHFLLSDKNLWFGSPLLKLKVETAIRLDDNAGVTPVELVPDKMKMAWTKMESETIPLVPVFSFANVFLRPKENEVSPQVLGQIKSLADTAGPKTF